MHFDGDPKPIYLRVYTERYGKVPKKWSVIHIDGNVANNLASNLIAVPKHLEGQINSLRPYVMRVERGQIEAWVSRFVTCGRGISQELRACRERAKKKKVINSEMAKVNARPVVVRRRGLKEKVGVREWVSENEARVRRYDGTGRLILE